MTHRRSRVIRIVRLGGVLAIFWVLAVRVVPERHFTIPGAALEQLRPLADRGFTRIAGPDVEPDRVTIGFRSPQGGDVELELTRREGPGGLRQESDCLAGEPAGSWMRCVVTGSASEEVKQAFRDGAAQAIRNAFATDPFTVPLSTGVSVERVLLTLCTQLLISFLWLAATGAFGYASLGRADAIALVPFLLALVIREGLTLHSIQEIEIHFASGLTVRHSVIYPLFQSFYAPLVDDSQAFTCHLNGVLGALAVLPLFLFMRQRTGSWAAGFLAALFFAVHPVLARFAPTDGPNSFLLTTWFAGLALLSGPELTGEIGLAGAALLGIAATCRMEGTLFLIASLFLLDAGALWRAMRRFPAATLASAVLIAGLVGLQMHYLLETHVSKASQMSRFVPAIPELVRDVLRQPESEDPIFAVFLLAGLAAGLISRRWRVGLGAVAGALVVIAPVTGTGGWIAARHEMVPGCALRVLAAGAGAAWLFTWVSSRRRLSWMAVLPGTLAAAHLFWINHAMLREKFLFDDEYVLVRLVFGPGGRAESGCVLLALSEEGDFDVHHFEQVVPETRVVDCQTTDCVRALAWSPCAYYLRSLKCYRGTPAECRESPDDPAGRPNCLNPRCARVESHATLVPVETRPEDVYRTFPNPAIYPAHVTLGLYRATAK